MIQLLGIEVATELLGDLAVRLGPIFQMGCQVRPERLDVSFARDTRSGISTIPLPSCRACSRLSNRVRGFWQ